jgi:cation:H+ antiporter
VPLIYDFIVLVSGVLGMAFSSERVVTYGRRIATALQVHPFLVGLTLVSIGTDLPEIVNALLSSYLGHGDINAGDSLGSAITQITLIMGLLALVGKSFKVNRREVISTGSLMILALFLFSWMSADGVISRVDSVLLLALWGISIFFIGVTANLEGFHRSDDYSVWKDLALMLLSFGGVALGAYFTINSVISLSSSWNIPEYFVSFIAVGIGTSLPELAVDFTAIRRGEAEIAIGDLMGSSLIDSTVSIALGALFFPITVSTAYVFPTALLAIFAAAAVMALLVAMGKVNKATGVILLLIYAKILMESWKFI